MIELNLNKSKILNNEQYSSKIGYDTRLYKECGSLAASCLFNKAKILCSKGEFGISDQDFSNMIGLPLRTFERAKKILKDRLGMRIGRGNKTYYSLINDLPYDPISYRSFDLNYLSITNNSYKLSAFLGQCFYWWNKALEKGEMEFSKTDKQIIDDLPFLSQDILTSIKKVAVLKGFISIKRKKRGGEWGVSHYTLYPNRIEKDIKEKCVSKSPLNDIILVVAVPKPSAKIPIECPPKSRLYY